MTTTHTADSIKAARQQLADKRIVRVIVTNWLGKAAPRDGEFLTGFDRRGNPIARVELTVAS